MFKRLFEVVIVVVAIRVLAKLAAPDLLAHIEGVSLVKIREIYEVAKGFLSIR